MRATRAWTGPVRTVHEPCLRLRGCGCVRNRPVHVYWARALGPLEFYMCAFGLFVRAPAVPTERGGTVRSDFTCARLACLCVLQPCVPNVCVLLCVPTETYCTVLGLFEKVYVCACGLSVHTLAVRTERERTVHSCAEPSRACSWSARTERAYAPTYGPQL